MTGEIPNGDSYERIMRTVNSNDLNQILFDFFKAITFELNPKIEIASFNGRVNNCSKRNSIMLNKTKKTLNCLNIYYNKFRYCGSTIKTDEKTNEIPTIEKTIKTMDLTGVIVTWDALNSQLKNVEAVIDAKGIYTIPIKGNQRTLSQDLIDYFDIKRCDEIIAGNLQSEYFSYTEKNSSIIKYEFFQTTDINWYSKIKD